MWGSNFSRPSAKVPTSILGFRSSSSLSGSLNFATVKTSVPGRNREMTVVPEPVSKKGINWG